MSVGEGGSTGTQMHNIAKIGTDVELSSLGLPVSNDIPVFFYHTKPKICVCDKRILECHLALM